MAFTLSQWINRAIAIAQAGEDQNTSITLNVDDTAEALCSNVMFEVAEAFASDPLLALYVTESVTLALVNGTIALPSRVLTKFMPDASVADPADAAMAEKMRWASWAEFIRPLDNTLGYFAVVGQNFFMTRPTVSYSPGTGMTGNVSLTIPCTYDMPASETATITVPLKVEEQLVLKLAERLKPQRVK